MNTSIKRSLMNGLEKLGAHSLISLLATSLARRKTKIDVEIFHDDFWIVRVGDSFIPEGKSFDIYAADIDNILFRRKHFLREPIDHWMHFYTPRLGDVVFDIGAGIGTDSLVFSEFVGSDGRVYAFEAHPTSFRRLEKTCRWNQLLNVVQIHKALWSEKGNVWISDLEEDVCNSVQPMRSEAPSHKVDAIDLDSFVDENGIDRIDFLKMNIEGAERDAIRGMEKAMKITKNIVIACHDFLDRDGSRQYATRGVVIDFLRDNKFEVSQRMDDPRPYVRDHVFGRLL